MGGGERGFCWGGIFIKGFVIPARSILPDETNVEHGAGVVGGQECVELPLGRDGDGQDHLAVPFISPHSLDVPLELDWVHRVEEVDITLIDGH